MSHREVSQQTTSTTCNCAEPCERCTCKEIDEVRETTEQVRGTIITAMIWLLVFCSALWGQAGAESKTGRPGLLVIAHGSPSKPWNQRVLDQEQKVIAGLGENSPYSAVKVVFMEFAEPNIADGIEALQDAGCGRIVAVPLLIAPSSHSHWDIPALLGIYSDPAIEKALREEGLRLVRPKVPVTLTTTLAQSDVIEQIMLKRVRQLSKDPKNEAVVLLAHGSEAIPPSWDRFLKQTVTYVCGQSGISYGDWATVAVGQEYSRGIAAIQAAGERRDRVIVVGAYLSLGVKRLHDRWEARMQQQGGTMHGTGNPFEGLNVAFSEQGLLPDEMVTQWIVDTARKVAESHR